MVSMNYPHFCSNFGIMWFLGQLLFYWVNLSWVPAVCHDFQNQTRHTFSSVSYSLQRLYFTNKVLSSQTYGFPSSHVWMWEVDYKESWALKNWWFWTVVLEKALRVPWTARKSNQSILRAISSEYSLEGLMMKLKLQYFGHLMQRNDSFEETLMLGKIEGGRRRGWQRIRWLDVITASIDMSLSKRRELVMEGRPGVLKPMGSQSQTQLSDWETELTNYPPWSVIWRKAEEGIPRWLSGKEPPRNAIAEDSWDGGLISRLGGSPREGNDNPLQYFCLENPMDRGARQL